MVNLIEYLRQKSIESLFRTETVIRSWETWKSKINSIINDNLTGRVVLGLGDHLSDIFSSTSVSGRGQSSVSGGGNDREYRLK